MNRLAVLMLVGVYVVAVTLLIVFSITERRKQRKEGP